MPHALLHDNLKDNHEAQARPLAAPRAPAEGRPRARRPPPLEPEAAGGAEPGPRRAPRSGGARRAPAAREDANEPEQLLQEDGLTPEFLRHFCETDDLASVQQLEIQVNGASQSIDTLGSMLPSLEHLKLTGSLIASVRELGTSLRSLQVLWLGRCGLRDLGGIASMECLRECYLPFNDIVDLYPLSNNEALEVLDLEGNGIADIDEVASLWICSQLTDLTLTGNPLCKDPSYSPSSVCKALPQLKFLDGLEFGAQPVSQKRDGLMIDGMSDEAIGAALPSMDTPFLDWNAHHLDEDLGSWEVSSLAQDATSESIGPACADISLPQLTHPLLVEGLREAGLGPSSELFAGEPDEEELVSERLKQADHGQGASGPCAALENPWFPLQRLTRPQTCGATPRPASACSRPSTALTLEDYLQPSEEASSDLTRGRPLSGQPLAVARQRRLRAAGPGEREPDIRALLLRHRDERAAPAGAPGAGAEARRVAGAPDVRVHRPPTPGELRPARSPGGVEQRLEALVQRRAAGARAAAGRPRAGAGAPAPEAEAEAMVAKDAAAIEAPGELVSVTSPSWRPGHPCASLSASPAASSGQIPNVPQIPRQAGEGRPTRKACRKPDSDRSPQKGQVLRTAAAAPAAQARPAGSPAGGAAAAATLARPFRSRSTGAAPARPFLGALGGSAALGFAGDPYLEPDTAVRGAPGGGCAAGGRGMRGSSASPEASAGPRKGMSLESAATLYSVIDPCPNLPLHAQAMFLEREAGLQHCLIAC